MKVEAPLEADKLTVSLVKADSALMAVGLLW